MRSMTGYGMGEAVSGGLKVIVELSSVNHKQFDLRVDMPRTLMSAESIIREQIHKRIARGFVSCRVKIDVSSNLRKNCIIVDEVLAEAYVTRLRKATKQLKLNDDVNLGMLLTLPGVVKDKAPEKDSDKLATVLLKSLKHALAALTSMRVSEGRALQSDIHGRLEKLKSILSCIMEYAPEVSARYRSALHKRICSSGIELNPEDPRLMKEVALFADRSDISEEITRLRSHMKQALGALASKVPIGRMLDFLMQEMFREINTIGSKANYISIVNEVVKFKAELERVREQVQNVE